MAKVRNHILGDAQAIKRSQELPPGSKSNYVNWDAIQEMPDQFEVVITELKFSIAKDFVEVTRGKDPQVMPTPQLMYRIAEACGISGDPKSIVEPIKEEVDINRMLIKPIGTEPEMRHMIVGRRVTKRAYRMKEDGELLFSSARTVNYNVWERCLELWSKEEAETDGYSNDKVKTRMNGDRYYLKQYGSKSYENDLKYDTPYKRQSHFDSEMKFAHAKAETQAYERAIRELAGLPTGYSQSELTDGYLIFSRVNRSRAVLQMETAARVERIRRGDPMSLDSSAMLFGKTPELPDIEPEAHPTEFVDMGEAEIVESEEAIIEQDSLKFQLRKIADFYHGVENDPELKKTLDNVVVWIDGENYADEGQWFDRAISILKKVHFETPENFRFKTKFFDSLA